MKVKNYYAMSEAELDTTLHNIREWLWNFQKHEQRAKMEFALDVVLCAKETYQARKADPWIQEVLDILC